MKKRISLIVGMLAVAFSVSMVQAAETRFAVQDAGGVTDKFVVHDNGYVGVGTATPSSPLHITATTGFPNNMIKIEGNVAGGTGGGGIVGYNNRAAGAQPLQGDRFGFIYFGSANSGVPGTTAHPAGFEAVAQEAFTPTSWPTYFMFATTASGSTTRTERMRITASGSVLVRQNLGINTNAPTSRLHVSGLPVYTNNAEAVTGGLTAGAFYRTGADPDVVCVVH